MTEENRAEEAAEFEPDGATSGADAEDSGAAEPEAAEEKVAESASDAEAAPGGAAPTVEELQAQLAERTADLQRLQAEYVNYKRRVDRDRELIKQNATFAALVPIIEVLDAIDRAREHGEVEGGFKAVADQLDQVVARGGLERFGTVGDPFDPTVHEALSHIGEDPEVSVTTCKVIVKAGYRIGERVVRAAQVLVVDPATPSPDAAQDTPESAEPGAADTPEE